ncbi:PadR family transcriptional regulator [Virgisporangium aliadipatigenens]|uniref:PadR family transcriptional regulator n=1 Tax=Virgisporangium aliadipatigenens TaxID=741659 RepID=A0A8J4DPA5_9ACTN|nr:helix-turn-helix transcriptional regulator [Virgisporangium aliadipatigenens]GIJ45745.1 PadR family transcriptional regulator [Virgisporangium aliadipatigenens]
MGGPGLRMTLQTRLVLGALLADPAREIYGLEIVDATGLPPGTIYPIMARLESAGWVVSRWEEIDQHAAGRPRRRYYRLSSGQIDGAAQARLALAEADQRRRRGGRAAIVPKEAL